MAIPPLEVNGLLPCGIHEATRDELIKVFCVGQRSLRAHQLVEFFDYVAGENIFRAVFVDGSFVTKKVAPGDVDVALEVVDWFSLEQLALHPTILRITQTAFTDQWGVHCEYAVHPKYEEISGWIVGHFQGMKQATAMDLGVPVTARKGIVKVNL